MSHHILFKASSKRALISVLPFSSCARHADCVCVCVCVCVHACVCLCVCVCVYKTHLDAIHIDVENRGSV